MVELFEQIEEGVDFYEAENTPTPEGKVINIAYLLILSTGGMEKPCEKCEYIMVVQRNCQTFNDHFVQEYKCYQIHKKERSSDHGYGSSEKRAQETDTK